MFYMQFFRFPEKVSCSFSVFQVDQTMRMSEKCPCNRMKKQLKAAE